MFEIAGLVVSSIGLAADEKNQTKYWAVLGREGDRLVLMNRLAG